jgi:DNA-binding GntR family transcriptional regulator
MPASISDRAAAAPGELTQLRLLIELSALRKLANRGLADEELALVRKLADDTMRPARAGDVTGYLRADTVFHLRLLELAGDPAVSGIAPLLLAPEQPSPPGPEEPRHLMTREAREHRDLAGLLADGSVSAVDHLVRRHLFRLSDAKPAYASPPGRLTCMGA